MMDPVREDQRRRLVTELARLAETLTAAADTEIGFNRISIEIKRDSCLRQAVRYGEIDRLSSALMSSEMTRLANLKESLAIGRVPVLAAV